MLPPHVLQEGLSEIHAPVLLCVCMCRGNILEVGDVVLKARTAKENGANRFVCPR